MDNSVTISSEEWEFEEVSSEEDRDEPIQDNPTPEEVNPDTTRFSLMGTQDITFSHNVEWCCGGRIGFHVLYGDSRYGGVMGKNEARRLAHFILDKLDEFETGMTEEEEYQVVMDAMDANN